MSWELEHGAHGVGLRRGGRALCGWCGGREGVRRWCGAAQAIGRKVVAGPSEGTVIGNLLVQAMALGAIDGLDALREVVACSFENKTYLPEGDASAWDEPYARLLRLQK